MRAAELYFDFETRPLLQPGNNYEMQVQQVSVRPNGQVLVKATSTSRPLHFHLKSENDGPGDPRQRH